MNKLELPFGMLFEERAQDSLQDLPLPHYDKVEQFTFAEDTKGNRMPYVLAAWNLSATQTFTHVRAEATDSDRPPLPTTGTSTKVRSESADND